MSGVWVAAGTIGAAAIGSSASRDQGLASGTSSRRSIREQRRQFDLQRADTAPYREAGANALTQLQEGIARPSGDLPSYGYEGQQPQFAGGDRFDFNLEADPGYNFARDEGIRATNREMAAGGKYGSGNRLAAIADRVTGVASQYADQAFRRQMASSGENYGRDVQEYGFDVNREGRDYSRGLTDFGLGYQREQDLYGREQDVLNRYASMAGLGQTAVGQSGAAGSNMANAIGNINMANAQQQIAASNTGYGSANAALQGGISNYLTYQQLQQPATGYGGTNVQGDAYQPSQNYYAGR
jgi:hypothetical protein